MQKTVEIRSRKNPEVTRTITAKAWPNWPKKDWELVDSIQVSETKLAKKKDVEAADVKNSVPVDDFVPPVFDDLGDTHQESTTGDDSGKDTDLESLRAEYEQKFGKPADKRMKIETIKAKINESI
jgi:anti-sigma28 factor (negative regulator of flagellin synthesis)